VARTGSLLLIVRGLLGRATVDAETFLRIAAVAPGAGADILPAPLLLRLLAICVVTSLLIAQKAHPFLLRQGLMVALHSFLVLNHYVTTIRYECRTRCKCPWHTLLASLSHVDDRLMALEDSRQDRR
jgi:hypothetical protein